VSTFDRFATLPNKSGTWNKQALSNLRAVFMRREWPLTQGQISETFNSTTMGLCAYALIVVNHG